VLACTMDTGVEERGWVKTGMAMRTYLRPSRSRAWGLPFRRA
jgi:hypothetical protein